MHARTYGFLDSPARSRTHKMNKMKRERGERDDDRKGSRFGEMRREEEESTSDGEMMKREREGESTNALSSHTKERDKRERERND